MRRDSTILDFSNPRIKRMVVEHIKSLKGLHRFEIARCREQRSLRANAYLWGAIYPAVQGGIEEAWGERIAIEEVHEWLKARFLSTPIVNRNTGEVVGVRPGSTAKLDTQAFSEYVDQIVKFAAEYLNVSVPVAEAGGKSEAA